MKKICAFLLLFLFFPSITFADTMFTNINNVPIQESNTSPRILWFLPQNAPVEIVSNSGEGYIIKAEGWQGWIYNKYITKNDIQSNIPQEQQNLNNDEKMRLIKESAKKYGEMFNVDPNLILAIIYNESNFKPDVISSTNDWGLMQICVDFVDKDKVDVNKLLEIDFNIYYGTNIFANTSYRQTADINDGNSHLYHALRAYNCGVAGAHANNYKTSADYANRVLKTYEEYKQINFAGSI